ncbi:hypothetical protein BH23VER1_BH23VER1_05810 [soil metagenome]
MNDTIHVLKKDCRWANPLIFLLLLAIHVTVQSPAFFDAPMPVLLLKHLLPMVIAVVILGVSVMVVLEDPVAGTDGFWLTRPIRGRALLAAKSLMLGPVAAAYLVAQLAILWMSGAASLSAYLVGGFVVTFLPLLVLVFAAASLGTSPVRFFTVLTIALVAGGALVFVIHLLVEMFFPAEAGDSGYAGKSGDSARVVVGALAVVGGIALAWHQFVTRRTTRTAALGGFFLAALAVLFLTWKIDFLSPAPLTPGEESALGLDRFAPELPEGSVRTDSLTVHIASGETVRKRQVTARVNDATLPDGWDIQAVGTRVRLRAEDGTRIDDERPLRTNNRTARRLVGLEEFTPVGENDGPFPGTKEIEGFQVTLFDLTEEELSAMKPTTLAGTVELTLRVGHRAIAAELPLAPGGVARFAGGIWEVRDVRPRFNLLVSQAEDGSQEQKRVLGEIQLAFHVRTPDLWLRDALEGIDSDRYSLGKRVVVLNRERHEILAVTGEGMVSFRGGSLLPVQDVLMTPSIDVGERVDEAWLEGATIGIVHDSPGVILRREIRVDGIEIGTAGR